MLRPGSRSSSAAAVSASGGGGSANVSRRDSLSPTPSTSSTKSNASALHRYLAEFCKGLPKLDKASGGLYITPEEELSTPGCTPNTQHGVVFHVRFGNKKRYPEVEAENSHPEKYLISLTSLRSCSVLGLVASWPRSMHHSRDLTMAGMNNAQ